MKFKKSLTVFVSVFLIPTCYASAQTVPAVVNVDSTSNMIVVALKDGDSLLPKLAEVVNRYGIRSGLILSAVGQVKNFTLSFYELSLRKTVSKYYPGPYDFATTQGMIAHTSSGSLSMDIVSVLDSINTNMRSSKVIYTIVGGHITGGIAKGGALFVIKRLDTVKLVRDYQRVNGTWGLEIQLESPGVKLPKDIGAGVKLFDYGKAVSGRTGLYGANANQPVFDVSGRRVNRLQNGRLEKAASGMYVVPPQPGKKGTSIIKQ